MKSGKLIPVHSHPVHHQGELFSDYEGYISILDDAGIDKTSCGKIRFNKPQRRRVGPLVRAR